jgi:RNA polymerase sigma-70 factor (ECF subfamily)
LVADHQELVFRTLYRLMIGREGIDDLAQEVFLRLYRGLHGFRGEAQIETYLYRIVVNVAHDARKRRAKEQHGHVSLSDDEAGWQNRLAHHDRNAEQQLQEKQFSAAVEQAMGHLSTQERAALVLYHQEEQSYQQVAIALGLPVNTVRTHLHRGRARLRLLLADCSSRGKAWGGKA